MANWLWPEPTAESTIIVRTGRACNLIGNALAVLAAIGAIVAVLFGTGQDRLIGPLLMFALGIVPLIGGRILRYILAGE